MGAPYDDNRQPDEGCAFCSVLDDEMPDACEGCPRSCGNCGSYRDCNLAQNDGRGVNCCGVGWVPEASS